MVRVLGEAVPVVWASSVSGFLPVVGWGPVLSVRVCEEKKISGQREDRGLRVAPTERRLREMFQLTVTALVLQSLFCNFGNSRRATFQSFAECAVSHW